MKRQPLGILLFPLKKSMKEVVLFDRKQRRRNKFELKKHSENSKKKTPKTFLLGLNKVTVKHTG